MAKPFVRRRGPPDEPPDLRERILNLLRAQLAPLHATAIAKHLGYQSKREINPVLYKLQASGYIKKVTESPPMWLLTESPNRTARVNSVCMEPDENGRPYRTARLNSAHMELEPDGNERPYRAACVNSVRIEPEENERPNRAAYVNSVRIEPNETSSWHSIAEIDEPMNNMSLHSSNDLSSENLGPFHNSRNSWIIPQTEDLKVPTFCPGVPASTNGSLKMDAGVIDSNDYIYITRNPVTALMEFAQKNHAPCEVRVVACEGPPHNPSFKACAYLGNRKYPVATEKTKKAAKEMAAEIAMKAIAARGFEKLDPADLYSKVQTNNTTMLGDDNNPISRFMNIAQTSRKSAEIMITSGEGPSHCPTFRAVAVFGDKKIATGMGKTKKEAKMSAASLALKQLTGLDSSPTRDRHLSSSVVNSKVICEF